MAVSNVSIDEGLGFREGTDRLESGQGVGPGKPVGADRLDEQAREVSGHGVGSHRTEVNQTREAVALEEKMIGPGVAETGL